MSLDSRSHWKHLTGKVQNLNSIVVKNFELLNFRNCSSSQFFHRTFFRFNIRKHKYLAPDDELFVHNWTAKTHGIFTQSIFNHPCDSLIYLYATKKNRKFINISSKRQARFSPFGGELLSHSKKKWMGNSLNANHFMLNLKTAKMLKFLKIFFTHFYLLEFLSQLRIVCVWQDGY